MSGKSIIEILFFTSFCFFFFKVTILHCIEQVSGKGGANQFADGFHAAKQSKESDPESFKLLSTTPIQFSIRGKDVFGEFHTKSSHATIE